MKIYRYRRAQTVPANLSDVWDYFSHPGKVPEVLPKSQKHILKSKLPRFIYTGMLFSFKTKALFGFSRNWTSMVIYENEPNYFIDEQKFGPFKYWHHQHIFTDVYSGVEIEDVIHYAMPFGFLGRIANKLFVAPRLRKIFDYRQKQISKLFSMPTVD